MGPLEVVARSVSAGCLTLLVSGSAAAQVEWRSAGSGPSDRHGHAMATDEARQRIVLFGGNSLSGTLNDTWEWSAGVWRRASPPTSPPIRMHHAMAYDPLRKRIVMFGGAVYPTIYGDTWEWDGANWTLMNPARSPAPRLHCSMAFDPVRGRILLVGGSDWSMDYYDTWEWDGTTWTQLAPQNQPGIRYPLMVTHQARQRVVAFSTRVTTMWEWNGVDWLTITPRNFPNPLRWWAACTYDARRERVVLFGGMADGNGTVPLDDTWEWDGVDWVQRTTTTLPPKRYWPAMAYDPAAAEIVLYGGRINPSRFDDVWVYTPVNPASYESFGAGCRGAGGIPRLTLARGLPWLGDTLEFRVTNLPGTGAAALFFGASDSRWGAWRLPFDLGAIGMDGCNLFTSVDLALPLVRSGGSASVSLGLCNCPELVGLSVYQQAFVQDPAANTLGLVASNGAELRIGAR